MVKAWEKIVTFGINRIMIIVLKAWIRRSLEGNSLLLRKIDEIVVDNEKSLCNYLKSCQLFIQLDVITQPKEWIIF